jgi:hypothetical protein
MRSLTLPAAWLLLPSGMFYRGQKLVLSFNRGSNSAYNEKDYDYVPRSKKLKGGRDPSRSSSHLTSPDKHEHNSAVGYGRSVSSGPKRTRSAVETSGGMDMETQAWKPRNEVKRSPVPRVLKGADLYVVRRTKTGLGCAQPCWRW